MTDIHMDSTEVISLENMQKDIMEVLLTNLFSEGLLSKNTYMKAKNLLYTAIDLPEFFWYPVCCQEKEDEENECIQEP